MYFNVYNVSKFYIHFFLKITKQKLTTCPDLLDSTMKFVYNLREKLLKENENHPRNSLEIRDQRYNATYILISELFFLAFLIDYFIILTSTSFPIYGSTSYI